MEPLAGSPPAWDPRTPGTGDGLAERIQERGETDRRLAMYRVGESAHF